jgi:hypothetical protein
MNMLCLLISCHHEQHEKIFKGCSWLMGYISSTPEVLDKLEKSCIVWVTCAHSKYIGNSLKPLPSVMQLSANSHIIKKKKEL